MCIFATVLAFNFLGNGIRDAPDPLQELIGILLHLAHASLIWKKDELLCQKIVKHIFSYSGYVVGIVIM